jgi:putative transposase
VRSSVEETLNALQQRASGPDSAVHNARASADRRDARARHYERKLETKAGEVKLRVPKLHYQPACTRLTPLPIEPSRSAIA